jgi:hypothetical protein
VCLLYAVAADASHVVCCCKELFGSEFAVASTAQMSNDHTAAYSTHNVSNAVLLCVLLCLLLCMHPAFCVH